MHPISDEIEDEFSLIAQEVAHLTLVLQRIDTGEPIGPGSHAQWEVTTLCATSIEKIYTGCERIMARIAAGLDGAEIGKGDGWHRALLDRMSQPFRARDAVLTRETLGLLDRMRAFRHRERNSYGFNLDTDIVLERACEAIQAFDKFAVDVRRLLAVRKDLLF